MRAGFGLIGLLVCVGVIALVWGKVLLPHTQEVLKKGETAKEQVNQIAGNSRDGTMKFSESLTLVPESKNGKIAAIDVTSVAAGGPAETYFGLKENDAIIEIGPLSVRDQVNSEEDASAYLMDAYQRQQQITVMRNGNKLTLPQNAPPTAASRAPQKTGSSKDETQQQIDIHAIPGVP